MNIALIGYRGTGKSTIARRLAAKLNMDFVDLDEEIVKVDGRPIPGIFAESGEPFFRELEKEAVAKVAALDNKCIACGGGAVLVKENIDRLKSNSTVILLQTKPEIIYLRVKGDKNRPALTKKSGIDEVKHMISQRQKLYEKAADFKIDTSRDSVNESVRKIIEKLEERKRNG